MVTMSSQQKTNHQQDIVYRRIYFKFILYRGPLSEPILERI